MDPQGKTIVVTGGASGIGKALCETFAGVGARRVIVTDLDLEGAERVAKSIGGVAVRCDVTRRDDLLELVEFAETSSGHVDIFCSNAGIATGFEGAFENVAAAPVETWQKAWEINVLAHVEAARILVPRMKRQGSGYFLNTVSAAGLLSQIGSAVYSTTKHAAVGFAENLAITHKDDGIRVSILCPQGVNTPMLRGQTLGPQSNDGVMSAEDVAALAIDGIREERFLILPHPQVAEYMRAKVTNYNRWIDGMAKLQRASR